MWFVALVLQALAHARLVESTPADGASLATPPATVTLRFDGAVEPALSRIELRASPPIVLAAVPGEGDARSVVVALPALRPGEHHVVWRVVSRDGHPVAGDLRFVVQ